ncbi:MAG: PAS domain S-box protein [Chitinophagaceae bacterium]
MFKTIKASTKLIFLVLALCGFIAAIGLYGVNELKIMNFNTKSLYEDRVIPLQQLTTVRFSYALGILGTAQKAHSRQLDFTEAGLQIEEAQKKIITNWEAFKLSKLANEENNLKEQVDTLMIAGQTIIYKLKDALHNKDTQALSLIINTGLFNEINSITLKLTELVQLQISMSDSLYNTNRAISSTTESKFYIAIAIAMILAFALAYLIIYSNSKIATSEEKYHAFVEYAGDAIIMFDKTFNISDVNEAACKLTGYKKNELVGMNILDIVDETEQADIERRKKIIIEQGSSINERTIKRKDGSLVNTEANIKRLKRTGYIVIYRDITERKIAEEKIRASEDRYKSIITVSNTGAFEYNIETNNIWCSAQYFAMLGEDLPDGGFNETIENIWINRLHPDDRKRATKHFDEYLKGGSIGIYTSIFRMGHKNGGWVWIWSRARTLRDQNGNLTNIILGTHIDITERKNAELAIKHSKEQYQYLFDNAPAYIILWELETLKVLEVNNAVITKYGYSKNEWEDMTVLQYRPEEDQERIREFAKSMLTGNLPIATKVWRHCKKSGELMQMEITSHKIVYNNRNAVLSLARDVTDQMKTGNELKQSEEKFRTLFEQAGDGIIIVNKEVSSFIDMNKAVCKLLGYTKEELQRLDVKEIFVKYNVAVTQLSSGKIIESGEKSITTEQQLVRKDGSLIDTEINASLLKGNGFIAIIRDITERKKAEEKQILLSLIVNSSKDAIISISTGGIVTSWNPQAETMYGYSQQEMIGNSISLIIPTDKINEESEILSDIKKEKKIETFETKRLRKDGTLIDISLTVSPIKDMSGKVIGASKIAQDITHRKHIEAELAERSAQLKIFIENSPAAIAMLDNQIRYIATSRRWLTDYNLGDQNIIGKSHYELFPEIKQEWKDVHHRCLQGFIEKKDEDPFTRSDGTVQWLKWEVRPWYKVTGEVGGIIMLTEEITKMKESELKFKNLVEQSAVGVFIIQNEKFAYVNPKFALIHGYEDKEMINTFKAEEVISKEYKEFVRKSLHAKIDDGMVSNHYEAKGIRKDGKEIWVEVYAAKTIYRGSPAVIGTVLDITMRKNAEKELIESEEKFRILVEQSLAGVYILQDEKFIYVNPGFEKISGYTANELLHGMSFTDVVHEDDLKRVSENYTRRISGERFTDHYTFRAIRRDGEIRFIEISVSSIVFKGIPAIIGTAIDITARLEEENRLSKAVIEAQEQERMQIGMELHDNIQQTLAGSVLHLDIIKMNITNKLRATELLDNVKRYIIEAIEESKRLSHRLAPSIESGSSLTDKINELVKGMNVQGKVKVKILIDEKANTMDKDIQLACYRITQEQFSNIIKYARASSVLIKVEQDKTGMTMTINDDGIGFDMGQKKEGIGLVNIRRRVQTLNGVSKIFSSPGKGCKIAVQIPTNK